MWAAQGEADVRTVVDTARLVPNTSVFGTISPLTKCRRPTGGTT
jgi:hypothetical protein